MRQAFDLLQGLQVKIVYVPDATIDNPNVAFYVSTDPTTVSNSPATNPNALDWLLVTQDQYNDNIYQWASETKNSAGATVTVMNAANTAARIAAGFFEVNFAHSIAAEISQIGPKCVAVIGTSLQVSNSLMDTRKWVGFLPVYDTNGNPTKAGGGLLGIPNLTGWGEHRVGDETRSLPSENTYISRARARGISPHAPRLAFVLRPPLGNPYARMLLSLPPLGKHIRLARPRTQAPEYPRAHRPDTPLYRWKPRTPPDPAPQPPSRSGPQALQK